MKIQQEKSGGNQQDEQQYNLNRQDFRLLSNNIDQINQAQLLSSQK
ncbi:unnamed protein product [Paramecium pentaurelia]|uniref:Uncharacterized protein n=1 Tax=Paramecium pentaurelia TaxID=43138 RepID=A0A8S1TJP1_9CILI|nr:unnamed protein product [Paramecium pentaurelia]